MAPPLDKMFLVIALIAMPNLYYRAEYNVPLMLFCFGVWPSIRHRPVIVYLIVFSWLIDAYCLIKTIINSSQNSNQPPILLVLQITVFVLKLIALIILMILDRESRQAIQPQYMCRDCYRTLKDEDEQ